MRRERRSRPQIFLFYQCDSKEQISGILLVGAGSVGKAGGDDGRADGSEDGDDRDGEDVVVSDGVGRR
ncbi:unnamed protein product [Cuscuta campestris]|uniref:Uncharacterized protein n=1 Tax=Cuscuta campestris TaxID=132261 RepID=A0A484KCE7_9ASTE|nr:unnamed protein product [Cuscuta campestris]